MVPTAKGETTPAAGLNPSRHSRSNRRSVAAQVDGEDEHDPMRVAIGATGVGVGVLVVDAPGAGDLVVVS